ncbi:hypothetical protein QJS10_CPA05g01751 [Acorus calamus]|uniref:Uncharacterized protein n=1 Tax=Acorus calamus TaxID=4465 RepID=A0AAV9EVY4_ACOCL|nr:hypothetical protein QJS10_CPA05g01751 [Acorus calamus]
MCMWVCVKESEMLWASLVLAHDGPYEGTKESPYAWNGTYAREQCTIPFLFKASLCIHG